MLQASRTCLPFGTFLLALVFPAWLQSYANKNPQLIVAVYNDAGVSASVLTRAEREATNIFGRAGVEVIWANCSSSPIRVGPDALVRAGERSSPDLASEPADLGSEPGSAGRVGASAPTWVSLANVADCSHFDWPTHLALRVLPRSIGSNEVFGVAFLSPEGTGCYSDVYYDRALTLHDDWNVGLADILGNAMAHELGHLLLGSNSHSPEGIMRARWQGEQLSSLAKGNLWFTPGQAEHMRGKLIAARPQLEVAAQATY